MFRLFSPSSGRCSTKKTQHWLIIYIFLVIFFFMDRQPPPVCLGLIYEVPRSHSDTPHSVGPIWMSDPTVADYLTTQHKQWKTHTPSAGFEPAIPASEGPQTPRLRPHGQWSRDCCVLICRISP